MSIFLLLPFLGPLAAFIGIVIFSHHTTLLAALMLFCGGAILYLTFQDIAPQAKLAKHWAPSLGAVVGFVLGILAKVFTAAP